MTKKNTTIPFLTAVLILAASAFAFAGPGYGRNVGYGPCGGPGGRAALMQQLTPEKQATVQKIFEAYGKQFDAIRTQMWTKHATLQAMINGGDANEEKIGELTTGISELHTQMRDLRSEMVDELEQVTGLTGFGRGFGCPGGPGGFDGMGRHHDGRGMMHGYMGGGMMDDSPRN